MTTLESWLEMIPFEHGLRKKDAASAKARWKIERAAYRHADLKPRIGMLLAAGGDREAWLATLATWHCQTWSNIGWSVVGEDADLADEPWAEYRRAFGFPPPDSCGSLLDPEACGERGYTGVVPVRPGDLLHPSLAGIVASRFLQGASGVAWDWLETRTPRPGEIQVVARRRAPACDPLAESNLDRRGRAYAVHASRWQGHPVRDAWRNRIENSQEADWSLHSEPLGLYPEVEVPVAVPTDAVDWSRIWGASCAIGQNGAPLPLAHCRRLSVILMYRDRVQLTLAAIASVTQQVLPGELELVLVDNQSSPASRATIDEELAKLDASVLVNKLTYDDDFNHSRQCNFAASMATGEVLVFLNNDAELLSEDALDNLSRWALVPGIGTVGVQMVDAAGQGVGGGFRARAQPGAEFNSPVEEAAAELASFSRATIGNTFACAAIARSTFLELGGLDELDFPVGFNDVEFCLRACVSGRQHLNLSGARVVHAVGASRAPADEVAQKLLLRRRHPWVLVHALNEYACEPIKTAAVRLQPLSLLVESSIQQNRAKESL